MTSLSGEVLLRSGDARICAESFGDHDDPAVLLIGGAASSMDHWDEAFCSRLADAGRFVIRYDLRDTGRSTSYPVGEPGYTDTDLAADVIAVLDGLHIARAHLFGISMGGAIAQHVAIDHPDRIGSLMLQSTTPIDDGDGSGPELPGMDPRLAEVFAAGGVAPDWTDRDAAIEAMIEGERSFAGSVRADDERTRMIATRAYDRTTDMAAMQTNHFVAGAGRPPLGRLSDVTAPTLVLHGTEDPLFPYGHGEALAARIVGARLVPLPGLGHQYAPELLWDLVISEVMAHTAGC